MISSRPTRGPSFAEPRERDLISDHLVAVQPTIVIDRVMPQFPTNLRSLAVGALDW
jgi:hypothetical protein